MEENVRGVVYRSDVGNSRDNRDNGRFRQVQDEVDRFWSKVALRPVGCWLWLGGTTVEGYGRFHLPGREVRAHRYAYELLVATIPAGKTLDHLCGWPACVRPSHLEPVTNAENLQRRHARQRAKNGANR